MSRYVIGISGASGAPYAQRTIQAILANPDNRIDLIITASGAKVLQVEQNIHLTGDSSKVGKDMLAISEWLGPDRATSQRIKLHDGRNVAADIASGSCRIDGMAVVPCSGGTLARIAHGVSQGLLERVADVTLKERRKLILVPRETPLSIVHLRNMLAVSEAGAIVMPASPGFYNNPQSIQDLIDMIAARILDHLGVDTDLFTPWKGA